MSCSIYTITQGYFISSEYFRSKSSWLSMLLGGKSGSSLLQPLTIQVSHSTLYGDNSSLKVVKVANGSYLGHKLC